VKSIDLSVCKPFKDFGRGFYLTTLERQAFDMARRTTVLQAYGAPIVSVFELPDDWTDSDFVIRRFNEPSREWAMFVMNNRNRRFNNPSSTEWDSDTG